MNKNVYSTKLVHKNPDEPLVYTYQICLSQNY